MLKMDHSGNFIVLLFTFQMTHLRCCLDQSDGLPAGRGRSLLNLEARILDLQARIRMGIGNIDVDSPV